MENSRNNVVYVYVVERERILCIEKDPGFKSIEIEREFPGNFLWFVSNKKLNIEYHESRDTKNKGLG